MSKHTRIVIIVLSIIVLMLATIFGTYRYIMHHQQLEYGENNTVYSTVFGYTDTYYVEPLEDDATTRIMNELYDAFNDVNQDGEYTITKDGNTISITK